MSDREIAIKDLNEYLENDEFILEEDTVYAALAALRAEEEGRVVVLPCKVGDTVYAIVHCDEIMKDCDDDYVAGTGEITCPFDGSCQFEECDDSNRRVVETCISGFWCESDGTWKVFLEDINADIGILDFGKTVFLAREAAEAALKGASNAE